MIEFLPLLAALAFGAAAAVLIGYGLTEYFSQGERISRRLMGGRDASGAPGAASENLILDDDRLRSFEKLLSPRDEEREGKIRRQLNIAGLRQPSAVRVFFAWKWGLALAGLVLGALFLASSMNAASPVLPIIMTIMIVAMGFYAADFWLARRIAYRRMDIERSFPDALDLMLVCIEAGNGLDQSIHRVARETSRSAPALSDEFNLVVSQLRAGKERGRVLADFSERCNVDDVAAWVTVLKQADVYGVSIADTLRVYAGEMRNKRYMRAEEKANMMPVKLALGAIVFTVPPTIIILIGPSIIMIARAMASSATGGA